MILAKQGKGNTQPSCIKKPKYTIKNNLHDKKTHLTIISRLSYKYTNNETYNSTSVTIKAFV